MISQTIRIATFNALILTTLPALTMQGPVPTPDSDAMAVPRPVEAKLSKRELQALLQEITDYNARMANIAVGTTLDLPDFDAARALLIQAAEVTKQCQSNNKLRRNAVRIHFAAQKNTLARIFYNLHLSVAHHLAQLDMEEVEAERKPVLLQLANSLVNDFYELIKPEDSLTGPEREESVTTAMEALVNIQQN